MLDNTFKILCIEDNPGDARLIQEYLKEAENMDSQIIVAETLKKGIDVCNKDSFDIILLDLTLPDSKGLDTVRKFRKECPGLPVVVLTGLDDSVMGIDSIKLGVEDYVVKGNLDADVLSRIIRYSIERSKLTAEVKEKTSDLVMSESRLWDLVQNIADAVLVISKDNKIQFVNGSAEKMFLEFSDELINSKFAYTIDSTGVKEIEIIRKDDTVAIGEMKVVESNWKNEPAYLATIRDITERKKSEQELKKQEFYYRSLLHKMHEDIIVIDREYIITDVNNSVLQTTGLAREKVIGEKCYDILKNRNSPCEDPEEICRLQEVFATGIYQSFQNNLIIKDKEITVDVILSPMLDEQGNVTHVIDAMRDITEKVEIQQQLKETSSRLVMALKSANVGIWDWNLITDEVYYSPEWKGQLGYGPDELGNRSSEWETRLHPDDRNKMLQNITDYLDSVISEFSFEFRLKHKDGSYRWISSQADMIKSAAGKPIRLLGCHIDVTDRLNYEQRQKLILQILEKLNISHKKEDIVRDILVLIKDYSGFDAVGLRIKDDYDYPYYESNGFSDNFLMTENFLCKRDENNEIVNGRNNAAILECLCGAVIRGNVAEMRDSVTPNGSFWTNNSTELFNSSNNEYIRNISRSRCNKEGYESIALIPLKTETENIGMLQLNSKHINMLTFEKIEFYEGIASSIGIALNRKMSEDQIKSDLKEKEVMLKEIHHRVKNNMQLISSMLGLQLSKIHDEKDVEIFKDSQNRIRSMAIVHEKLYQSGNLSRINFNDYIKTFITYLSHTYNVDSNRVTISMIIDEIYLSVDIAIPCAQIINELVSNALKYAFPDDRQAVLEIEFKKEKGIYSLMVSDNGIGFPENIKIKNPDTLGLRLVEAFTEQLQGAMELKNNKGTEITITFSGEDDDRKQT